MALITGSIQLGFLYGILAVGIFISFRIMDIPDLTTEGSFTFGLAASAACTAIGHPWLGVLMAIVAGCAAGAATGLLQTKLMIHPVLAGIITMTGLYSINLKVLGGSSNLSLVRSDTVFRMIGDALPMLSSNAVKTVISVLVALIVLAILIWFFRTHLGMCLRATGDNPDMVRASSIDVHKTTILSLCISNACVALSGGMIAQYQGYADISSGTGILVVGLASVIIGEAIIGKRSVPVGLMSAVFGSLLYRFIIAWATKSSLFPAYMLKLVSAIIVAIALAIPAFKYYANRAKVKKGVL